MNASKLVLAVLLSLTLAAGAQTAKPSTTTAKPAVAAPKSTATASTLPTEAEVNEFLRRMFGFDPNATWSIQAIVPAEAPGVAHVLAIIGGQRPVHLYVLPGGKFAAVGDVIPFGADPFGPIRTTLNAKAKGPRRGPESAPVTLVEFSDLECPFCRNAQPIIDRLSADFPDVRLIFQPFPLPQHKWAMKAASYAECVGRQKPAAFWDFVSAVYDDQANINDANATDKLGGIATNAGVDASKVAACSEQPDVYVKIQQSIDLGKSIGVNSTPTLYLNGRKISAIADLPYEQLKVMVQFEVTEASKKK